ncbi:MAG: hypothetical protein RIC95_00830 [Vicingaceae bacterium]
MPQTKLSSHYKLNLLVVLLILYLVGFGHFSHIGKGYPYGDGIEYLLTTEAWATQGNPEINTKTAESFIGYLQSHNIPIYKKKWFQIWYGHLQAFEEDRQNGTVNYELRKAGLFQNKEGKLISYHFPFLSLINTPARIVLHHLEADIRFSFLATNLFLIVFSLYVILTNSFFKRWQQIGLSLLLIFSPVLWYIDWPHPEVYAGTLTFIGGLFFISKKYYKSLLCFSLAAMHFQPLFIPAALLFIPIIKRDRLKLNTLVKLFFCSFWVIVPALFYLYHFGKPNLIVDEGFLDPNLIGLKRLSSFFFDLNQGMLIGIPFILISLILLLLVDLIKRKLNHVFWGAIVILLMSLFFLQMTNWNHGNAVVNRYVVWTSTILIVAFFDRILKMKKGLGVAFLIIAIGTQAWVVLAQKDFGKIGYYVSRHNELAKYVFRNYPALYNPDPQIFIQRNNRYMLSSSDTVKVFTDKSDKIVKMMFYKNSLNQMIQRGVDSAKLAEYIPKLNFYLGYTYLNPKDLKALGYNQDKDTLIEIIERDKRDQIINNLMYQIHNTPEWKSNVEFNAKNIGISYDSALKKHAETYYINDIKKRNE